MKSKLVFFLVIAAIAFNYNASGQLLAPSDSASSYVVIGAFQYPGHAQKWIKRARAANMNAISALNKNRNLYYVYTLRTDDRPLAFEEAAKIRKDTLWWDTWVYTGTFKIAPGGVDTNPLTGKNISNVKTSDNKVANDPSATKVTDTGSTKTTTTGGTDKTSITGGTTPISAAMKAAADSAAVKAKQDSIKAAAPLVDNNFNTADPNAKKFLFKILGAESQKELVGKVDVIDLERARKFGSYAGNKTVLVNPPNKSGDVNLICQVFGYRKYQRTFNFFHPSDSGGVVIANDIVTVPFELVRLQKGDFAVMYNVYFYKDAAVMRPESKYEVNSLLDMMKENPKYKIRIHGHTNGNASGKVTSMGDSKNYFSLVDTHEGYGSAKKLSEERAMMMKQYLVDEGVSEHRMSIKAWGGKKPVYDKNSPQAQANVRVEIEIVEDK